MTAEAEEFLPAPREAGPDDLVIDKNKLFEKLGYRPHPRQRLFHDSTARFRVPCCGRRFGKSKMAATDLVPELFLPNRRYWIVGPTYDLAEKEFRVVYEAMQKLRMLTYPGVHAVYNKAMGRMSISFPWGTILEVRSAQHPENLVGDALHGVIMSEAAKQHKETWERFIQPALTDFQGWATFPSTPEGFNWYYELWQQGQSADPKLKDYASWQFPSWENPYVFRGGRDDSEIERVEATSIRPWFLQEYGAEFSAFVGKIYEEFREVVHVRAHTFRPEWPNYIAFDWGFTNPLAAIEFQVDPMDNIYVWRQHYASYMTLERHIELLKQRPQPEGYHLDLAFGDAADPGAALTVSQYLVPCMADPKAKEDWRGGVNLVKRFLMPRDSEARPDTPGALPSMFIDHSCVDVIREFNNYRAPNVKADQNVREAAQAYDDHALDAIRYALVHLFTLGAGRSLSEVYGTSDNALTSGSGTLWVPSTRDDASGHTTMDGDDAGYFTTGVNF